MAAGMLLTDARDRILLVKTHYRADWGLPGGVAEEGEPPHRTCEREIAEELGLDRRAGDLLLLDFVPADETRLRTMLYLVFDGGTVLDPDSITPQADEIADYSFLNAAEAERRMHPRHAHRLPHLMAARAHRRTAYLPRP
ncbi:NUDIX domain-containing protein [Actinomadura rayongensis]|uniref:NUDIX domain-containing protein n=1 Tax=Actinomadura rayongensis TaxID=1429076 RepID=A0A6I4W6K2_9ACTN|nr:NUDIX domain-containing protein [Actinomadura rayongensis]